MRKFLLISHGKFAEGCRQSLKFFIGDVSNIEAICGYVDDIPVKDKISTYMKTVNQDDELIVCSDLTGGSVNQLMVPYLARKKTFLVAGFNFALLMELTALADRPVCEDDIRSCVEGCKNTMVFVNDLYRETSSVEGDE